jgi:hypothetical protein
MAKINYTFVSANSDKEGHTIELNERVADATEALLKTITVLDNLAKPKQFVLSHADLLQFEQKPSMRSRHTIMVDGYTPVEEIVKWQVTGKIGERFVNVVVYHLFHTFKGNRSGNGEYFINGKTTKKPEYGGITLEDIWDDNHKWDYKLDFVDKIVNEVK